MTALYLTTYLGMFIAGWYLGTVESKPAKPRTRTAVLGADVETAGTVTEPENPNPKPTK